MLHRVCTEGRAPAQVQVKGSLVAVAQASTAQVTHALEQVRDDWANRTGLSPSRKDCGFQGCARSSKGLNGDDWRFVSIKAGYVGAEDPGHGCIAAGIVWLRGRGGGGTVLGGRGDHHGVELGLEADLPLSDEALLNRFLLGLPLKIRNLLRELHLALQ
jgi:hypothetical protein